MRVQTSPFNNRVQAGKVLAERLQRFSGEKAIVLGLARGGVIVAAEVARELGCSLDVMVARKIGAPSQPELGIGAVAPGDVRIIDHQLAERFGITDDDVTRVVEREEAEVARRLGEYRGSLPPLDVKGRTVILVDDGLATGITALAAIRSLRQQQPARIIAAFPVCSRQGASTIQPEVDELVCSIMPDDLYAVGKWYEDFSQVEDHEVLEALRNQPKKPHERAHRHQDVRQRPLKIALADVVLNGDLSIPEGARGIVLFAHGSGSSRLSPRNRHVAEQLNQAGLATLLVDLLTEHEEREDQYSGHLRFDIGLLSDRLAEITEWMKVDNECAPLPIGYFGASTGAGAALAASLRHRNRVKAIVSRGGRPDLAGSALAEVVAPTLLIVGSRDVAVLNLNRDSLGQLGSKVKELQLVEGATHLFEEPGAMEQVAEHAKNWFVRYLA